MEECLKYVLIQQRKFWALTRFTEKPFLQTGRFRSILPGSTRLEPHGSGVSRCGFGLVDFCCFMTFSVFQAKIFTKSNPIAVKIQLWLTDSVWSPALVSQLPWSCLDSRARVVLFLFQRHCSPVRSCFIFSQYTASRSLCSKFKPWMFEKNEVGRQARILAEDCGGVSISFTHFRWVLLFWILQITRIEELKSTKDSHVRVKSIPLYVLDPISRLGILAVFQIEAVFEQAMCGQFQELISLIGRNSEGSSIMLNQSWAWNNSLASLSIPSCAAPWHMRERRRQTTSATSRSWSLCAWNGICFQSDILWAQFPKPPLRSLPILLRG